MSHILEQIIDRYPDESLVKARGFNRAIIGVDVASMRLVYSVSKCIDILRNDLTIEEAIEYFEFSVRGTYVGEKKPIWCEDNFDL